MGSDPPGGMPSGLPGQEPMTSGRGEPEEATGPHCDEGPGVAWRPRCAWDTLGGAMSPAGPRETIGSAGLGAGRHP